jgi:hypothetical protein
VFLIGIALLLSTAFGAKADVLDFSCGGGTPCSGTLTSSNGNFRSNDIVLGSSFDTSTNTISLVENGADQFVGTITGFSAISSTGLTDLDLAAD